MNAKQIKGEVIRYLEDNNYRYAILIEGEWGCGKTYFVTHDLLDEINNYEYEHTGRKVRYISLYGCKSVEEVEENIYCSMLDEQFYKLYNRLRKTYNFYGHKKEKIKRTGQIIANVTRKFAGTIMQRFEISYKAYEYVSDFFTMNKNIFIFDDLERCGCSPNDILGYINGLVEHEGAKVILVAYEKEIGFLNETGKKELQYMVAANKEIQIPPEKTLFSSDNRHTDESGMNIEELARRSEKLFEDKEINQQYIKIREKLIGKSLEYKADMIDIMHKLILDCKYTDALKRSLNDNVRSFIGIMDEYKHRNLRTFQFFLSKIKYLNEQFNEAGIDKAYAPLALNFLIVNCFMLCVEYKADFKEPEDIFARTCHQNKYRLKTVKDYVEHSLFDEIEFNEEIDAYVQSELSNRLLDNDPFLQLCNKYYISTQKWVEEKIKQVLGKLEKNEYNLNVYPKMLVIFLQLIEYGFPEEILKEAETYMIANAKKEEVDIVLDAFIPSENPKIVEKCKEIILKINKELCLTRKNSWQRAIQHILETEESWGKKIEVYWKNNERNIPSDVQFFNSIDTNVLITKILSSDAENIHNFRTFLSGLYRNVTKINSVNDMKTVNTIIEKLEGYNESDLIKKVQLSYLKEQLVQIKQYQQRN